MLNLFYQKNTLNDTLIINVSLGKTGEIKTNGDIVVGYDNNQIKFVNILNASKHIPNLKDGLLFPTDDLVKNIEKVVGTNLSSYFDNGFRVGYIEKCEDIKGTHLHKCVVDIKSKKIDVVCGAPNCKQGLKVVVATNGTMLPRGKAIVAGSLLGFKSEGMLCSYRELNISKDSKGIIELDNSFSVGDYFKEAYVNLK